MFSRRPIWFADLAALLAVFMTVAPAAAMAADDACRPVSAEPVERLLSDVAPVIGGTPPAGPPVSFEDLDVPASIPGPDGPIALGRVFAQAQAAVASLEQQAELKKLDRLDRQVAGTHSKLVEVRRNLEQALDVAASDPIWMPHVEAALAKYYGKDGLLWRFTELHAKRHYQRVLPIDDDDEAVASSMTYQDLNDLNVSAPPDAIALMTGGWMAALDPSSFADGRLEYNSYARVNFDQEAIANWTGIPDGGDISDRHLWNLQLELAHTQLSNWVSMDMLRPDGGKDAPCVSGLLQRRFMSLRHPEEITEYLRWLTGEKRYRAQLANATKAALASSPPLTTPELIRALRDTVVVPRFHEPQQGVELSPARYDQVLAGVIGSAENQLAPVRFRQLLQNSGAPLSSMSPQARQKHIAMLATRARAWAVMQAIDALIQEHNADNTTPHANKNSDTWKEKRLQAIIDGGFLDAYADDVYSRLDDVDIPAPRRPRPGEGLDEFASVVTTAGRTAGQLSEEVEMMLGGLPVQREIRVTPAVVWAMKKKGLARQYDLDVMSTADNGDNVLAALNGLFAKGARPIEKIQADYEALRNRLSEYDRKVLDEMKGALGLTGDAEPLLEDVFAMRDQRVEVLRTYLKAMQTNTPLLSQPMSAHDDKPLYEVLHEIYLDEKPLYELDDDGRLVVKRSTLREFVHGDPDSSDDRQYTASRLYSRWDRSPSATREAQRIVDQTQDPIFEEAEKDTRPVALFNQELRLDPKDPADHLFLYAIGQMVAKKEGVPLFRRNGERLVIDPRGLQHYTSRLDRRQRAAVARRLQDLLTRTLSSQPIFSVPGDGFGGDFGATLSDAVSIRRAPNYYERSDGNVWIHSSTPWGKVIQRATAGSDRVTNREGWLVIPSDDPIARRITGNGYGVDPDPKNWTLLPQAHMVQVYEKQDDGTFRVNSAALVRALSAQPVLDGINLLPFGEEVRTAQWAQAAAKVSPADVWNQRSDNRIAGIGSYNPSLFTNPYARRDPIASAMSARWNPQYAGLLPGSLRFGLQGTGNKRVYPRALVRGLAEYRRYREQYNDAADDYRDLFEDATDYSGNPEFGFAVRQAARDQMKVSPSQAMDRLEDKATEFGRPDFERALEDYWRDVNGYRLNPTYLFAKVPERALGNVYSKVVRWMDHGPLNERLYKKRRDEIYDLAVEWPNYVKEGMKPLRDALDDLEELSNDHRIGDWLLSNGEANLHEDAVRDFLKKKRAEVDALEQHLMAQRPVLYQLFAALPSASQLDDYKYPSEGIRHALTQQHEKTLQWGRDAVAERKLPPKLFDFVWNQAVEQGSVDPVFSGTGHDQELNDRTFAMTPSLDQLRGLRRYWRNRVRDESLKSSVAGPKMRMDDALESLAENAAPLMPMHAQVQGVVSKYVVADALREQLKKICENLEKTGEKDDRDELMDLLASAGARSTLLEKFPEFTGRDGRMVVEYFDHETGLQKATHWATTALVIGLTISYFIPGVNLFTGWTAPFMYVALPTLFAAEAAWGYRDIKLYQRRLDFAQSMGRTTNSRGELLGNDALTEHLQSKLFWSKIYFAMDLAFALMEGGRLAKYVTQVARGGVIPLAEAQKNLAKFGVEVGESTSLGGAQAAVDAQARAGGWLPTAFEQGSAEWKQAMKKYTSAMAAAQDWKAARAKAILQSHGFEIPRSANEEQLSNAFRKWVKDTSSHPDHWPGNSLQQFEANKRFKEVQEALAAWKEHLKRAGMAPRVAGQDTHWPLRPRLALPAPR